MSSDQIPAQPDDDGPEVIAGTEVDRVPDWYLATRGGWAKKVVCPTCKSAAGRNCKSLSERGSTLSEPHKLRKRSGHLCVVRHMMERANGEVYQDGARDALASILALLGDMKIMADPQALALLTRIQDHLSDRFVVPASPKDCEQCLERGHHITLSGRCLCTWCAFKALSRLEITLW